MEFQMRTKLKKMNLHNTFRLLKRKEDMSDHKL